jgi:hypothetical protein
MYKKFALMLFLGTGILALPATAAEEFWLLFGNTNPITYTGGVWRCHSTVAVSKNVGAQVCTIRSGSGNEESVGGVIIVRNNNNYPYDASASLAVYSEGSFISRSSSCPSSGVRANSWSVCFGSSIYNTRSRYYTGGYVNNTWLGYTGYN